MGYRGRPLTLSNPSRCQNGQSVLNWKQVLPWSTATRQRVSPAKEAARPVLSATVYARQKHPFLAPPAALAPGERLYELVQETLRGPALASLPFYDRGKVVALLDELPSLSDDDRSALDPT